MKHHGRIISWKAAQSCLIALAAEQDNTERSEFSFGMLVLLWI